MRSLDGDRPQQVVYPTFDTGRIPCTARPSACSSKSIRVPCQALVTPSDEIIRNAQSTVDSCFMAFTHPVHLKSRPGIVGMICGTGETFNG